MPVLLALTGAHVMKTARRERPTMRIAISGAHRVGKSTLVEALGEALPKYVTIPEPYELLEEDGYESATPPTVKDFEAQLERSLEVLAEDDARVIFDRCPADLVAYLLSHADSFDLDDWLERVRDAMQTLDLVVFVPIAQTGSVTRSTRSCASCCSTTRSGSASRCWRCTATSTRACDRCSHECEFFRRPRALRRRRSSR